MPSFEHHGARIYYEEFGRGFPILTFAPAGSEKERTALRVLAENIPGVRGIEDHMISGPRYLSPLFPAP